jgi:hypothetical protein
MAGIPWPTQNPEQWQEVILAGVVLPGLCKVKVSGGQKIDKKDAPGADGESTTQQGERAKTVDITLRMWTPEQWAKYQEVHGYLEPPIGKRVPLDIVNAKTTLRRVKSIIIETIEGPDWDPDKGFMTVGIKAVEHKPPPPKAATKKNTAPKTAQEKADALAAAGAQAAQAANEVLYVLQNGVEDAGTSDQARRSSQQGFPSASGGAA